MQTATFTCDQCGRAEVHSELPSEWRRASLQSIDGDNVGDYSADLCSPKCAAEWVAERFQADLRLQ